MVSPEFPSLSAVDVWTQRMAVVAPSGFDERAQEDILVIIKAK